MRFFAFMAMAPVFLALGVGAGGFDSCSVILAAMGAGFFASLPAGCPCAGCGSEVRDGWCLVCGKESVRT